VPYLVPSRNLRRPRRRYIGQFPIDYSTIAAGDINFPGNMFPSIGATPGSSFGDVIYNAATGNVSPSQVAQIKQQQTSSLIQAGMDPSSAQAQAESDVNTALQSFSAPGAFEINWMGGQPGGANWLTTAAQSVDPVFGIPWWVWLAGGGVLFVAVFLGRR
jgi:hypothetical protein